MVRLREALAGREMLLILDNCEHLIAAAAEVADDSAAGRAGPAPAGHQPGAAGHPG